MSRNILLVEPDYPSKFPPLGLLRIGTYHKSIGDNVLFVRGRHIFEQGMRFSRIYISSLFTWELPRTIKIIKFYKPLVNAIQDIVVGGIGITLLPDPVRDAEPNITLLSGALDKKDVLEKGAPSIENLIPDFSLLEQVNYAYKPEDSYFLRISKGCIRKCSFCAVPILEPKYGRIATWRKQLEGAKEIQLKVFGYTGHYSRLCVVKRTGLCYNVLKFIDARNAPEGM